MRCLKGIPLDPPGIDIGKSPRYPPVNSLPNETVPLELTCHRSEIFVKVVKLLFSLINFYSSRFAK